MCTETISRLEAVIADIRAQGIDERSSTRRHGEQAAGSAANHGCADGARCRACARQSRPLADRPAAGKDGIVGPARLRAARRKTSRLAATVPPTRVFRDQVFLCHATPGNDDLYWLETVTPDGAVTLSTAGSHREGSGRHFAVADSLRPYPYRARGAARRRAHGGQSRQRRRSRLFLQRAVSASDRGGHARRALRNSGTGRQRMARDLRHVPYDHEAMAALARRKGFPEFASALATGWIG